MRLYKLTDENGCTKGGMQWGENVTHEATGSSGQSLCSDGWIHTYESPLLAILLNPIGAAFINPQMWEAEGTIGRNDKGLKCGCRSLTTIKRIPIPKINTTQRIAFGILCTMEVYKDKDFTKWAQDWISGRDRTALAAWAAARAAEAAAEAVARAAEAAARVAEARTFNIIKLAKQAMEVK